VHFSRWAFVLDAELGAVAPAGGVFADAVAAVGVAARAFVLRFGPRELWPVVARLSGGEVSEDAMCRCRPRRSRVSLQSRRRTNVEVIARQAPACSWLGTL